MVKRISSALVCALLLLAPLAQAQKASAPAKKESAKVTFTDVKLKNGMRLLLSEDHSAPVYSISVVYNVGARNEVKGRTGFAHLFEHMMFAGSENVGKNEHSVLIKENGGSDNGTTDSDRTLYFETLPSNQLDLGMFLEADRMRALNVTKEALDIQRNAVQEERRFRVDNQPYGSTFEAISDTIFDSFPYKHSVIGSMADLDAATVNDVKEFFRMYYAPNNATVAIVGDFDTKVALEKARKYFETIPRQPDPPAVVVNEPKQMAERRKSIDDGLAPLPRLTIMYKTLPDNTPDAYALDILMSVLTTGQSSRLYQKLVKDQQLAAQVGGGEQGQRGVGMAQFGAIPSRKALQDAAKAGTPAKALDEIEKSVYEELDKLKKEPPTQAEIDKVRTILRYREAQQLQGSLFRSILLAEYATFYNDPNLINTEEAKYQAVTQKDLLRVANQYFDSNNRSVITTLPKRAPAAGGRAGR